MEFNFLNEIEIEKYYYTKKKDKLIILKVVNSEEDVKCKLK